ncbi:MAG TPA: SAM-dependent methyltransferase [Cytophagales bacterium]|nr:SAM-dependent methyltransferase [Cytophagales bacterium]
MYKVVFGAALLDYCKGEFAEHLRTSTSISDEEVLPVSYLFRSYEEMPFLEQRALNMAHGKILDVGCGAGSHSLWLQNKGYQLKAIDISKGAVEVCKKRGIQHVEQIALMHETGTFDTILLLMNGTGIFETLEKAPLCLDYLKSLISDGGQILIDSSDIKYMYEDEDGGLWIDVNAGYYGELDYFLSYKGNSELPMKWLYLDFAMLRELCIKVGLHCEKVADGPHYDYLARLTLAKNQTDNLLRQGIEFPEPGN